MPDATVGNARTTTTTTKTPNQKGKPLGIPPWGWIIGIVAGLLIGYLILKNKNTSGGGSSSLGSGSDSSPLGNSDSGSGGGASSGSAAQIIPAVVSTFTQTTNTDPGAAAPPPPDNSNSNPTSTSTPAPAAAPVNPYLPDPTLPAFAPIPGTTTHQGGNVPIQNIPINSNIHQPGVQIG